jgi:hypothetical protein
MQWHKTGSGLRGRGVGRLNAWERGKAILILHVIRMGAEESSEVSLLVSTGSAGGGGR